MTVRLTRTAQRQRAAILKYRAEVAGRRSAVDLRADFKEAVASIGGWSPPGASRTDLASAEYRFVLVKPYWVIWRFDEDGADLVEPQFAGGLRRESLDVDAMADVHNARLQHLGGVLEEVGPVGRGRLFIHPHELRSKLEDFRQND